MDDDDKMVECPACDAQFQVIVSVSLATLPPPRGYREGYFCPCCGHEFVGGYFSDDGEGGEE